MRCGPWGIPAPIRHIAHSHSADVLMLVYPRSAVRVSRLLSTCVNSSNKSSPVSLITSPVRPRTAASARARRPPLTAGCRGDVLCLHHFQERAHAGFEPESSRQATTLSTEESGLCSV